MSREEITIEEELMRIANALEDIVEILRGSDNPKEKSK